MICVGSAEESPEDLRSARGFVAVIPMWSVGALDVQEDCFEERHWNFSRAAGCRTT